MTGYQAINQAPGKISNLKLSSVDSDLGPIIEQDTDENVKTNVEHFATEVMRESITAVKAIVTETVDGQAEVRGKLTEINEKLGGKLEVMEKLRKVVEGKRREIEDMKVTEEKLLTQIADRAVELDRLGASNLLSLSATLDQLRSDLSQRTETVNMLDKQLSRVKTDYAILLQNESEKDKLVKELRTKLTKLKKDMKEKVYSTVTETSELAIRASIFKAQIQNHEKPNVVVQESGELIREINETLAGMKAVGKLHSEEFGKMKKKVQNIEDRVFAREEEISKMTASYQESKFDLILHTRECKSTIQSSLQSSLDQSLRQQKAAVESQKKRLREELDQVRESFKPVSRLEYDQTREKLLVILTQNLKIAHSLLISQNRKVEDDRKKIKTESQEKDGMLENTASTIEKLREET